MSELLSTTVAATPPVKPPERYAKHAQAMSAKPDTRISDLQQHVKVLEEKVQALEEQMKKVNQ